MAEACMELGLVDAELGEAERSTLAKHSARYVRERNPRLARGIEVMLAWGISQNVIVEELEVSPNLVAAIAETVRPVSLETHKREIISGLQRLGRGILRRMTEMVEGGEPIPFKELAIAFGITTEKEQLLQGLPTGRMEQVESPAAAAFKRLLLEQASVRGMVLEAEILPQKAASQTGELVEAASTRDADSESAT